MDILIKEVFQEVEKSIFKYARPLEKSLFNFRFKGESSSLVINELKKFQNDDGGFGHGLESDFRLPDSSPMATSIALRILSEIENSQSGTEKNNAEKMIKEAILYLENTFDSNRNGWFVATRKINDFPHAPWWNYDEELNMTVIDRSWGNPTAEILAYLYKYRAFVKKLDLENLLEYAVSKIENKEEYDSEHEIFCYIKLYEYIPEHFKVRLEKTIIQAIDQLIEYDIEKWNDYLPMPLDFVSSLEGNRFGILESKIEDNLHFFIKELNEKHMIKPPWGTSFYEGDLRDAYNEWIGVLSLKALIILENFNKIEFEADEVVPIH